METILSLSIQLRQKVQKQVFFLLKGLIRGAFLVVKALGTNCDLLLAVNLYNSQISHSQLIPMNTRNHRL